MSNVNWRRVLAISFLIFSLALICCSIYLHLRQKSHFGRLQRNKAIVPLPGVDAVDVTAEWENTYLENIPNYDDEAKKKSSAIISEACLRCICQVVSECKSVICAANVPCGIFRISKAYWIDAGSLKVKNDNITKVASITDSGYGDCVNDIHCSNRVVVAFVDSYARDCNHDGVIDCRDHIALHILGPQGCMHGTLSSPFDERMKRCLAGIEQQQK